MTMSRWRCHGSVAVLLAIVMACAACTSSHRYLATPLAIPSDVGLTTSTTGLELRLHYRITPNGPGSWLKDARWHEYVVTLTNRSDRPLTVNKFRLIDPRGVYIDSEADPWNIEKASDALLQQYKDAGIVVGTRVDPSGDPGHARGTGGMQSVPVAGFAPVGLIAVPVYGAVKHYTGQDREAIEREFTRRLLSASTLAGHATITGSRFFPIVPRPQALVIEYQIEDQHHSLQVSLEGI